MSDPYIGEIRMFAGVFAPQGWLLCQGQLVSTAEFDTLFALIGTTYGGDGQTTFALPDLSSRLPVHQGPGYPLGAMTGVEEVTLTTAQLPVHSHVPLAAGQATSTSPLGGTWAGGALTSYDASAAPDTTMSGLALNPEGGSQPHDNVPPYLAVNFIISTSGTYPSPA